MTGGGGNEGGIVFALKLLQRSIGVVMCKNLAELRSRCRHSHSAMLTHANAVAKIMALDHPTRSICRDGVIVAGQSAPSPLADTDDTLPLIAGLGKMLVLIQMTTPD